MTDTFLFDLDGTLLDSIELILAGFRFTCVQHRRLSPGDDVWLSGVGTPLREQFRNLSEDPADIDAFIDTYRGFNVENHDHMARAYPGVQKVVRALVDRGARLAIVSSKRRMGVYRGLRRLHLESCFDAIVAGDDVQHGKPHPEAVETAMDLLSARAETTVFIGDSPHDMAAGAAAGVRTGAALWGPFERPALEPHRPDHWFVAPEEILQLCGNP